MNVLAVSQGQIREIVTSLLSEKFPKIRVLATNIREHKSDTGDEILEINVVFDSKKGDFDPKEIPELVEAVSSKLAEADDTRFPILSFIAKSDLGKTRPEAA